MLQVIFLAVIRLASTNFTANMALTINITGVHGAHCPISMPSRSLKSGYSSILICLAQSFQTNYYGILYEGYIKNTNSCLTIHLRSVLMMAVKLYVGQPITLTQLTLINNDGAHGNTCIWYRVSAGRLLSIAIPFFQITGGDTLFSTGRMMPVCQQKCLMPTCSEPTMPVDLPATLTWWLAVSYNKINLTWVSSNC